MDRGERQTPGLLERQKNILALAIPRAAPVLNQRFIVRRIGFRVCLPLMLASNLHTAASLTNSPAAEALLLCQLPYFWSVLPPGSSFAGFYTVILIETLLRGHMVLVRMDSQGDTFIFGLN